MPSILNHRKVARTFVRNNPNMLPNRLEIVQAPPGTFRWRGNDGHYWSVPKPSKLAAINELTSGKLANQG